MEQSKAVVPFVFEENEIRTLQKDGEIWFVAKDVCEVLDIANYRDALSRLDEDEKGVAITDTLGGPQEMLCANESGLYHLIFTSRKESARKFRRWVTEEVLPSIRKTGKYDIPVHQTLAPLPPPLFKDGYEAYFSTPRCSCPTREQVEIAIITTVQWLQPYCDTGVTGCDLMMYNAQIQAYRKHHSVRELLAVAESLTARNILTRFDGGAYYYNVAPVAGYLPSH